MISEKQKKIAFKQCLHELRTKELADYPELEDLYKNSRDRILFLAEDLPVEENIQEAYKEKISGILNFMTKSFIEMAFQPREEECQETIENILRNIENLRSDIKTGIIDLDKIDRSNQLEEEWGGAGVVISSDKTREGNEGDIVVHTIHAKTITWMMERLRDTSGGYLNYMNKYEFYGRIAENIKKYIKKNGDSKERLPDLIIHSLDEAIRLIKSWE